MQKLQLLKLLQKDMNMNPGNQNFKNLFAGHITKQIYSMKDKDFKLSPHEEAPAVFARDSPIKPLKGLQ